MSSITNTEINDIAALIESTQELQDHQRALLRARIVPLLRNSTRKGDSADKWDNGLFLGGFCGSLIVTIATAINLAGYVSPSTSSAVSTAILVLSSLATGTLALRERLRLRETVVLCRRFSALLQRSLILFLAHAHPYLNGPQQSFQRFVSDVETLKSFTDQAQLRQQQQQRDDDDTAAAQTHSNSASTTSIDRNRDSDHIELGVGMTTAPATAASANMQ